MRVVLTAGARPNFVKIAPVLAALDRRGIDTVLVHTGQHYGASMSDVFFAELGIRVPDHHLGAGSGTHAAQTAAVMVAFEMLLDELHPDVVVVPGDVNGTLACALVASKAGCLVGHIEAGLRSRDWSMPEEVNRVVTDRLSDLLFAPSQDAVGNLAAEGYRTDQIHLVGNVMVDTLLGSLDRARARPTLSELRLAPGAYGLVTLHRPSNVDDDAVLAELLATLAVIADRMALVLPAHPRAADRIRRANTHPNVRVIDPLGYLDFLALQAGSALVLTDSGGVQEETTVLGIPCLTLRENTERPITVEEGTNRVVGRDRTTVMNAVDDALAGRFPVRHPELWDGKAAERIVDVMIGLDLATHPRPTDLPVGRGGPNAARQGPVRDSR